MRWLLSGLTAAIVMAILPAMPAAADTMDDAVEVEDHFHVETSTSHDWPERSVTVNCPAGEIVWGFGGATIGGTGYVALTEMFPNSSLTAVTVTARARGGWRGDFSVQATATCWRPGNVALERMDERGRLVGQVECPAPKVVYASGFQVSAVLGEAYVARVEPDLDMSGVTVMAGGADPRSLSTRAVALCGLANVEEVHAYQRTHDEGPVKPAASTLAKAPRMYDNGGWAWVTGAGAGSTAARMFIDALGPVATLDAGIARMSHDATTPWIPGVSNEEDEDEMTVWGTNIGGWYSPPPTRA